MKWRIQEERKWSKNIVVLPGKETKIKKNWSFCFKPKNPSSSLRTIFIMCNILEIKTWWYNFMQGSLILLHTISNINLGYLSSKLNLYPKEHRYHRKKIDVPKFQNRKSIYLIMPFQNCLPFSPRLRLEH